MRIMCHHLEANTRGLTFIQTMEVSGLRVCTEALRLGAGRDRARVAGNTITNELLFRSFKGLCE